MPVTAIKKLVNNEVVSALLGRAVKKQREAAEYEFAADLFIDGVKTETAKLPATFRTRRHELFWKLNINNLTERT